ncbi:MAG TPA: hypothetical protein VFV86_07475 [Nitrososphaeraceae archaeon]|nr:hypothetical protein [Nitrososphaeraceae archaeon]
MIGIYKITNPKGKVYIGQSWNLKKRQIEYKSLWGKGQDRLYNSIKKYGWENHTFKIIHELPIDITQEVLDNYENLYWSQYRDCGFEMMNIREPLGNRGRLSEETKQKISKSNSKKKRTKEHIESLNKTRRKGVLQINPETNEIINEFISMKEAGRILGINASGITEVIRGRQKTSFGYKWKLKD